MIDPGLKDQDINFAVTQRKGYEPHVDVMDEYYKNTKHVFGIQDTIEDLFSRISGKKKKPRPIWSGDRLVLWVDLSARSNHLRDIPKANANAFQGSFFVNGIFFAHEPLSVMPFLTAIGAYKPQIMPSTPTHKWLRL